MAGTEPDVTPSTTPVSGLKQTVQKSSLKLAGYSFVGADGALFLSGVTSGKFKEAFAGVFGWMAGLVGSRYGEPKMDKLTHYTQQDLGEFFQKQGVAIPEEASTEAMRTPRNLRDSVESFLFKYPSQVMNAFYSMVGLQFVRSAVQHKKPSLFASGVLLITGAMNAIFTKQKPADPEHPPQTLLEKAKNWVQEKPLRTTGALFNINQVTLALDALQERARDPEQKSYLLKLLAVAGFSTGNVLMGMTDKSQEKVTGLDATSADKVLESSARVVAAQPKEKHDSLIEQVAGFLSAKPSMSLDANAISTKLHDLVNIQLAANTNSLVNQAALA